MKKFMSQTMNTFMNRLYDISSEELQISPEEELERKLLVDIVKKILERLTSREQKILKMRFGIGDERAHTLIELGREFNVTGERIRQIQARALEKISVHPDIRKLMNF